MTVFSIFFFSLLFSFSSFAQQQDFAGLVQYLNGEFSKTDPKGVTKTLSYKDVIGSGDKIQVIRGPHIKIVTRNRCIFVIHEGTLAAPKKDESWILDGTMRAICPSRQAENIIWRGSPVKIREGEAFFRSDKLVVVKDHLLLNKGAVKKGVYLHRNGKLETTTNMDARERFRFNTEFGAPAESIYYGLKEPEVRIHSRWWIGLAPIGVASVIHGTPDYSYGGGQLSGGRLMAGFAADSNAWLYGFDFRESQNSWDDEENKATQVGVQKTNFQLKNSFFVFGRRWNFQKSSGFYALVGIGSQEYKIESPGPLSNDFVSAKVKYASVSFTGGYEKIFWADNWLGFSIQLEAQVARAIYKTDVGPSSGFSRGPFPKAGEDKPLTMIGASFIFGPVFSFD